MDPGAPCSDKPVNLKTSYNASSNANIELFGNFTNLTFTGYQVSGAIWKNEICFAGICRIGLVYEATTVEENNWYLNTTKDSAYGVIGMGPISPFWDAYTNAEDKKGIFSIALARNSSISRFSNEAENVTRSNITFGYANDAEYLGQSSLTLTSLSNFTYALDSFGIGPVFFVNGVAASSYYKPLVTQYPVELNTNFIGMGAPQEVYKGVYNWLVLLEKSLTCDFEQDGYCTLDEKCSVYQDVFEDFVLYFRFTSNMTHSMRIPLSSFAMDTE